MNAKERIARILKHQPVDRIGIYEHFWPDTRSAWAAQGHISEDESLAAHFNLDMDEYWTFNMVADLDFPKTVVAETEETITYLDGNGATLKQHKLHDSTPEHVDFKIKEREDWESSIKPILWADPRRIDFEGYRKVKQECEKDGRFFVWSGFGIFETIAPLCGHENMLIGMALDPDWVKDMAMTYADMLISLQEQLFEKEGLPDGIWYYEDMGYKNSPFMSPDMYCDIIQPAHKKIIEYAHSKGLPVIMHSCGFVEPLVPHIIEAGIDCLEVIEIKAGMDLLRLHKMYGDKIALMGGIDVRTLYTNDLDTIDGELKEKLPVVKQGFGYVAHSDHSIPKTVDYATFCHYIEQCLRLGQY